MPSSARRLLTASGQAPHRGSEAGWRRTTWVLLALAALAYSGIAWEAAVGFPLGLSRSLLSELAAADQPTRPLFATTDLIAAGLVAVACLVYLGVTRAGSSGGTSARVAWGATVAFALGTIVDVSFPMPCAPSGSAACRAEVVAAHSVLGSTASEAVHTVASIVVGTATVVLALALAAAAMGRLGAVRAPAGLRVTTLTVSTVLVVATAVTSWLTAHPDPDGYFPVGTGVAQRLSTLAICGALVLLVPVTSRGRSGSTDHGKPS